MTQRQNFPSPTLPIIDPDGNLNRVWQAFLMSMFKRAGGVSGDDGTLETAVALAESHGDDIRADVKVLMTALYTARSLQSDVDTLRRGMDALTALTVTTRQPIATKVGAAGRGIGNLLEASITVSGAQTYALATSATSGILFVNGLNQNSTYYTVTTGQLNIPGSMGLVSGDSISFLY